MNSLAGEAKISVFSVGDHFIVENHSPKRITLQHSQYRTANDYRSDDPRKIGQQPRRDCMPRLLYTNGSEIHRRDIKRGLRASVNRRCCQADDVVGSETVNNVGEKSQCRAAAEWSH